MKNAKILWTQRDRAAFRERFGYSQTSHYATGGLRQDVLQRDKFCCVRCGLSDEQHKARWGRPITIDHKDKNRRNNTLENLQTLCLRCHGKKDISPHLIIQKVPQFKEHILQLRKNGQTYQAIADNLHFSAGAIWRWCQRWEQENLCQKQNS